MKKTGIVLAFLMGLFGMMMGQQTAPQAVLNTFQQQYPNAGNAEWHEEDGVWEGGFMEAGTEVECKFTVTGQWIESEK